MNWTLLPRFPSCLVDYIWPKGYIKKVSQHILLHCPFGIGTYDYYTFFVHKDKWNLNEFKEGPLKKCFLPAMETPPNMFRVGHRYPLWNVKCSEICCDSFFHILLGLNSLPGPAGSCEDSEYDVSS